MCTHSQATDAEGDAADGLHRERGQQGHQREQHERARGERAGGSEPQQDADRRNRIPPSDLLPGCPRAWRERDRPLVDPVSGGQQLRGDLRLDVEPVSGQLEATRRRRRA